MSFQNLGSETSASTEQLTRWLGNLDRHGDELVEEIRQGRVKVMTTDGFSRLYGIASSARSATEKLADAELRNGALTSDRVLLLQTLFYVLKSFEGVAHNVDKVAAIVETLALRDGDTLLSIIQRLMTRPGSLQTIMANGKTLMHSFDASWFTRINVDALLPLMREVGVDVEGYAQIPHLLQNLRTPATASLPAGDATAQ